MPTGASVSIMLEEVWNRNFAGLTLEKSQVKLKTYTGEALDVIGQARVNVSYKDQTAKLPWDWPKKPWQKSGACRLCGTIHRQNVPDRG